MWSLRLGFTVFINDVLRNVKGFSDGCFYRWQMSQLYSFLRFDLTLMLKLKQGLT